MGAIADRRPSGGLRLLVVSLALAALFALGAPGQADAAPGKGKGKVRKGFPTGSLVLRIGGLPRGERGVVTLVGPRQSRRSRKRFHRRITRLGKVRLRGLRTGRYRLKVSKVSLRRRHGTVRRGASAFPTRRRLRVKVKRRKVSRVNVGYGTIRNPAVRALRGRVVRVVGSPRKPRRLVLRTSQDYRRGTLLTSRPKGRLSRGLFARVVSVRRRGRLTILRLKPASIYDAVPNARFRTRLQVQPSASVSLVSCEGGGLGGVTPYVRITDVWTDGGWTTSNVWPFGEVKTGARLDLDFDVRAGVEISAEARVSCSLELPGLTVQGFPAGIPLYGSINPFLTGTVGGGARMKAEGKVRVDTGAQISGIPPGAWPTVSFGSPEFSFSDEVFADVGLGFGINSEAGLGVAGAANLHVAVGNSLDFGVGGGLCKWDLRLGTFSAGGELGRWKISTPTSPPLYSQNLWQVPCGPPPLSTPLDRAKMSWDTDADIDLYAWDEDGNLTYFGETDGIDDAELVEDIIPSEGEDDHDPEVFRETGDPGRRYTFGVCLYSGDATDVTLEVPSVPDPRGPTRSFDVSLDDVGDGEVVTTSPEGDGYDPSSGWCRSAEE